MEMMKAQFGVLVGTPEMVVEQMRALTAASLSLRRATSATAAPASASTSAKRTPSPLEVPVTSATFPLRLNSSAAAICALDLIGDATDTVR